MMMNHCRYGPAKSNSDSAVNILLDVVNDQSGKIYKMDHWATRFPTNTVDIAHFLVRLTRTSDPCLPTYLTLSDCLILALIVGQISMAKFRLLCIIRLASPSPNTKCA